MCTKSVYFAHVIYIEIYTAEIQKSVKNRGSVAETNGRRWSTQEAQTNFPSTWRAAARTGSARAEGDVR